MRGGAYGVKAHKNEMSNVYIPLLLLIWLDFS